MTAFLFFALSAGLVVAAAAAALRRDAARASWALLPAGAALAGLLGLIGAAAAATVQLLFVAAAELGLRRARKGSPRAVPDEDTDAAVVAAGDAPETLRVVALAAALVALLLRPLFMARWPFAAAPQGLPLGGLSVYLAVAVVLLATGVFAMVVRRSSASAWIGVVLMQSAAALALAAAGEFIGNGGEASTVAMFAVIVAGVTALVALSPGLHAQDAPPASDLVVSADVSMAIVGIMLALLATGW